MGSFIADDKLSPGPVAVGEDGKPLQGWSSDPTGRHAERYFSVGVPTKLYRDGTAEGYDDISAESFRATRLETGASHMGGSASPPCPVEVQPTTTGASNDGDRLVSRDVQRDAPVPVESFLELHWVPVGRDDSVSVEMDIRDDLRGPSGSGVVSTLVETAGTSAIATKSRQVATEHMAISFLAPGHIGPIRATATPLQVHEHEGVAEVKVTDSGNDDQLIAVATVTVRILG